jgi:hypothetical protein
MADLQLTQDQQEAYRQFIDFICDPHQSEFVISGYAGTGKSTLVSHILKTLPTILRTVKLLTSEELFWKKELTATTNKAAEALQSLVKEPVGTIHSLLSLKPYMDTETFESQLTRTSRKKKKGLILFIDEASYIDHSLLHQIFRSVEDSKIIFIGDPAQLSPVKSAGTPAFELDCNKAHLTEVVRQQAGNQIIDLATSFRNTVNNGDFFSFAPNNVHVTHLPRGPFESKILDEFRRADFKRNDAKVLAWTNDTIIAYNRAIRKEIYGRPDLQPGDYAICNSFFSYKGITLRAEDDVFINEIHYDTQFDVNGWTIRFNDNEDFFFMPENQNAKKQCIRKARKEGEKGTIRHIYDTWIDLRATFACTINKSQGSTYQTVFIDLDDVKKCNNGNQIARMMYVAVSRASKEVFLTGDLV